jgi:hypothetical protein
MQTFHSYRSINVEARQCAKAETVATDLGFINMRSGDWLIHGEDGESYVVDDAFFKRTFAPDGQTSGHETAVNASASPSLEPHSIPHPRQLVSEVAKIRKAIRSCRQRVLGRAPAKG